MYTVIAESLNVAAIQEKTSCRVFYDPPHFTLARTYGALLLAAERWRERSPRCARAMKKQTHASLFSEPLFMVCLFTLRYWHT